MALLLIAGGILMSGVGISAWFGWYRSWAKAPLGNIMVPGAPTGLGVALVGVAGQFGARWLGFPAAMIALGGVILYVISPGWLEPRWYRTSKRRRSA